MEDFPQPRRARRPELLHRRCSDGVGPFSAVYLATSGWSQGEIGRALSVGSLAAILS